MRPVSGRGPSLPIAILLAAAVSLPGPSLAVDLEDENAVDEDEEETDEETAPAGAEPEPERPAGPKILRRLTVALRAGLHTGTANLTADCGDLRTCNPFPDDIPFPDSASLEVTDATGPALGIEATYVLDVFGNRLRVGGGVLFSPEVSFLVTLPYVGPVATVVGKEVIPHGITELTVLAGESLDLRLRAVGGAYVFLPDSVLDVCEDIDNDDCDSGKAQVGFVVGGGPALNWTTAGGWVFCADLTVTKVMSALSQADVGGSGSSVLRLSTDTVRFTPAVVIGRSF